MLYLIPALANACFDALHAISIAKGSYLATRTHSRGVIDACGYLGYTDARHTSTPHCMHGQGPHETGNAAVLLVIQPKLPMCTIALNTTEHTTHAVSHEPCVRTTSRPPYVPKQTAGLPGYFEGAAPHPLAVFPLEETP